MPRITLTVVLVLAVIYIIPFIVYGTFSVVIGLKPPEGVSPVQFLVSVLISEVGTAVAFVLIFYTARHSLTGKWLAYSLLWWLMFVIGEVGQALGPHYTWEEAIAGVLSETLYFPLSGYLTKSLIGPK